jgi:hypothetical protein
MLVQPRPLRTKDIGRKNDGQMKAHGLQKNVLSF